MRGSSSISFGAPDSDNPQAYLSEADFSQCGPDSLHSSSSTLIRDAETSLDPAPEGSRKRAHSTISPLNPLEDNNSRARYQSSSDKNEEDKAGSRRAAKACLRCRKQKLKCVGGNPCDRCVKFMHTCDFQPTSTNVVPVSSSRKDNGDIGIATARLEQLESNVADLLAGLARGVHPTLPDGTNNQSVGQVHHPHDPWHDSSIDENFGCSPIWPTLSSGLNETSVDSANRLTQSGPSSQQANDTSHSHVRFYTSPTAMLTPGDEVIPSDQSGSLLGNFSSEGPAGQHVGQRMPSSKRLGPAERLAAVTAQPYDPPFKALTHEPRVWDNREASRINSPNQDASPIPGDQQNGPPPHWHDYRANRQHSTPLSTGIVDLGMAQTLFQFFVDHCHTFIPVVDIAHNDSFNVTQSSPPLFSAILAIAARFYARATERLTRMRRGEYPVLPRGASQRLANLAEMHLGYTLLTKTLALSDFQAILLLSAWGLQPEGRGPDAWIVTGHAARVARRLGVYKVLAHATETGKRTQQGTDEWTNLEAFLPQWRTWLCWFGYDNFLSLGFGRPQSEHFDSVDENVFLQIRKSKSLPAPDSSVRMALHGDIHIAGWVTLARIGRDLTKWTQMLANPERSKDDQNMREWGENRDLQLSTMFKELNGRLDDWSKLWVWTGSPYALHLGSLVRIARVQSEHLRLCLNSYALKAGADEDELIGKYLKKALNAALGTIQTHCESNQTDLALSFATDYLIIALAQSAFFLVRISCAPEAVRNAIDFDPSVVLHYLQMSVDLLESSDITEIRLPTFLAKTIRDIAVSAGITTLGTSVYDQEYPARRVAIDRKNASNPIDDPSSQDHNGTEHLDSDTRIGFDANMMGSANEPGSSIIDGINFSDPFADGQMFDLASLLGIPGDNTVHGDSSNLCAGTGFRNEPDGYMAAFSFP